MAGVFAMNDDEINSLSGRLYDVSWALDELDMPTNPGSGPMGSLGLSNSLDTFISEGDRRIDTWSSWASNTADAVGMASRQSQRTDDSWSRLFFSWDSDTFQTGDIEPFSPEPAVQSRGSARCCGKDGHEVGAASVEPAPPYVAPDLPALSRRSWPVRGSSW